MDAREARMAEHYKVVGMATAIAGKAHQLGLRGPVTVRLTSEDGAEVERMLGGAAAVYNGRDGEATRWFENAGIRFEWPRPPEQMSNEERKNLGL